MRLYPPISRIDRICTAPCVIDGHQYNVGDWIIFSIWGVQHSDEYWTEPEEYRPERCAMSIRHKAQFRHRFLPENRANHEPYAYMPFGAGPRACVGQRLAMLEMKVAIFQTLRRYKLLSCDETPVKALFS